MVTAGATPKNYRSGWLCSDTIPGGKLLLPLTSKPQGDLKFATKILWLMLFLVIFSKRKKSTFIPCRISCFLFNFSFFQVVIIISGNFSFLNWLTMLPAIFCFDDGYLQRFFSKTTRYYVSVADKLSVKFQNKPGNFIIHEIVKNIILLVIQ